ncbi:TetR/AcrR family transcriptional regulator [Streptomyces xiangluensis]|uniref:TetR/AcrR family transcriptional regulator n=1 Tax=Streptomyces xiangluensis TaxID=2665720 RepID=A0ABV8YZP6_9ACTN
MNETGVPAGRLPLRERKKQRTRETLTSSALEMFTELGFDETTLDDLCDRAEVSKRTLFRYFTSKEDVAMAPTQDFWRAFLDEIAKPPNPSSASDPPGPFLGIVQEAMFAAMDRMPGDDWAGSVRLSRRLAAQTPSMNAHGLGFCDRSIAQALATLTDRFSLDASGVLRARLVLEFSAATFRCALEAWAALPGEPRRDRLVTELRGAFAAMPDALTLAG